MEKLAPLGSVTGRGMFGGYGIFFDGKMFALIANDTLYFKAGDANRQRYSDAGSAQFMDRMPYFEVPVDVLEDDDALREWANESIEVALQSPTPSRRRKRAGQRGQRVSSEPDGQPTPGEESP